MKIGVFLLCSAQLFFAHTFIEYHLIDTLRIEQYKTNAHQPREFMMHVWIPDDAQQPCLLIIFSHGLGPNFNGMTYQQLCTYCASRGYVVASVSHSYACKPIQFLDGRTVPYGFPALFHHQSNRHMFDVEADVWLADMICALNECVRLNTLPESQLYQKIDMSRVGAMGHSLGGAAAIQLCRNDERIKAVIDLDGPLYGTHSMHPIEKPFMLIIGSSVPSHIHQEWMWRYHFNQIWLPQLDEFIASLKGDVYKIAIDKIVHETFSDEVLCGDAELVPWIMDGTKAHEIIHAYVGAFFDTYLSGESNSLLTMNASPWKEVSVSKH